MGYQCIIVILKNLWMGFSYLFAVSITAIRMHFYFDVGLAHDVHACAAAAAAAVTVLPFFQYASSFAHSSRGNIRKTHQITYVMNIANDFLFFSLICLPCHVESPIQSYRSPLISWCNISNIDNFTLRIIKHLPKNIQYTEKSPHSLFNSMHQ